MLSKLLPILLAISTVVETFKGAILQDLLQKAEPLIDKQVVITSLDGQNFIGKLLKIYEHEGELCFQIQLHGGELENVVARLCEGIREDFSPDDNADFSRFTTTIKSHPLQGEKVVITTSYGVSSGTLIFSGFQSAEIQNGDGIEYINGDYSLRRA